MKNKFIIIFLIFLYSIQVHSEDYKVVFSGPYKLVNLHGAVDSYYSDQKGNDYRCEIKSLSNENLLLDIKGKTEFPAQCKGNTYRFNLNGEEIEISCAKVSNQKLGWGCEYSEVSYTSEGEVLPGRIVSEEGIASCLKKLRLPQKIVTDETLTFINDLDLINTILRDRPFFIKKKK